MLDTNFLKSLLSNDFYEKNKEKLSKQLFEEDIRDLYQVITQAHEEYNHDLSTEEIFSLWKINNPVATKTERYEIRELIEDVKLSEGISEDIAAASIEKLWQRHLGKIVMEKGLDISEGRIDAFNDVVELIEAHRDGFMPNDLGEPTTLDIGEIWDRRTDEGYLEFPIPTLAKRIPGIHRRKFGVIFARPNVGKTAFVLTLACGPGGYIDQGHKVLILGNEESTEDTIERAYGTALGMTKKQIAEDRDKAIMIFKAKMQGRLVIYDCQDWSLDKIEAAIDRVQPAAVFIDQLDKVDVSGKFNATHERLGEVYRRAREVAKRHNCLVWGISQASNDAKGKTRVTYDMMAGSKINKAAEADLIIGLGKQEAGVEEEDDNPMRFVTVSKNKINGWHGVEICNLHGEVSRYVA